LVNFTNPFFFCVLWWNLKLIQMCTEISRKSWRIYDLLLSPRTDELQDELFCVALSVVPFMGHTQLSATKTIIVYYHEKYFHGGSQALLAALRQRYWRIGGRKFVVSVINKCVRCVRMKPVTWEHVMGSLPANRVQPNPAFHTTGVDYCGPFYHKAEARNMAPHRCYIAVFVCFSTKAAHLEVVQDLTTDSFIAALRILISLRRSPRTIWSDNA